MPFTIVDMMSLNNSERSLKAEGLRESCSFSRSYRWGRQVCGLLGWVVLEGGISVLFLRGGENESFRARKVLLLGVRVAGGGMGLSA